MRHHESQKTDQFESTQASYEPGFKGFSFAKTKSKYDDRCTTAESVKGKRINIINEKE